MADTPSNPFSSDTTAGPTPEPLMPLPAYTAPPMFVSQQPAAVWTPTSPAGTNPFDSRAVSVLVVGILGLVLCQFLGPIAWYLGAVLKRDAAAGGYPEPSNGKAGRILGIVSTALLAAAIALLVMFIGLGLVAGTQR